MLWSKEKYGGTLYVGEEVSHRLAVSVGSGNSIQADGDELQRCLNITGLPRHHARSQTFTAPWSRLIIENWR
jgi:hypothetical protein